MSGGLLAMTDAERKLTEWLAQYSEAEQERILQYAIDHILPNLLARRLHPLRCEACNYQHGHAIGCKNNPVDSALKEQRRREAFDTFPDDYEVN